MSGQDFCYEATDTRFIVNDHHADGVLRSFLRSTLDVIVHRGGGQRVAGRLFERTARLMAHLESPSKRCRYNPAARTLCITA